MDVEILARLQFALTIGFHYIYPPLSIGLGLFLVFAEGCYMWTKKSIYKDMARWWTKVFALTFAMGVATGIVMEFEFGTNWASYSRYVGDVFGSALAAEGVFAFFLESGFLALLLFGWNRISERFHFFATIMVALGAHFSAIWIVVANSWMQTPAGFHIVGEGMSARAEITGFWAMVFNPSSVIRLGHVVVGCWLAGAFLVISVSAYYLLKKRHLDFAKKSLTIALCIALFASIIQGILGDASGRIIAVHQPAKLAAFEGLFESQREAPLSIVGLVNTKEETIDYQIAIPKLLSFLAFRNTDALVTGLDQFPRADWPNTAALFITYRLMIGAWILMLTISLYALYALWKGALNQKRWLLWIMVFSVLLPAIGNEMGWISTEMGRYPWIVQDLLRISDGLSKAVTSEQVLGSIIMFGVVYLFLFATFLYLLNEKIQHGPYWKEPEATPYAHLKDYILEVGND